MRNFLLLAILCTVAWLCWPTASHHDGNPDTIYTSTSNAR